MLASGALFGLGFLAFAFAMFRAHSTPRWPIVLAVVGGLPFAVNFLLPRLVAIVAVSVFGVGLVGFGSALWKSVEHSRARFPATPPNAEAREANGRRTAT